MKQDCGLRPISQAQAYVVKESVVGADAKKQHTWTRFTRG